MRRREFITLLGGAVAWPIAAVAQGKSARIGGLVLTSADAQGLSRALRDGLREQGYIEGQNFSLKGRTGTPIGCPNWRRNWFVCPST
jgi:putative ABC transport system substrate-binding protein